MGWRDDDDYDDIDLRRKAPPPAARGGAALGVASVVISILSGVGVFIFIGVAGIISIQQNGQVNDNDPKMMAAGLGIIGGMLFAVIGLVLGFVGVFQSNSTGTISAILGIVFNGLILLGVLGLMCAGVAMG